MASICVETHSMSQLPRWTAYLIAPTAGAALTLAFSPYDLPWLALPALALLYWTWLDRSAKRAAVLGYGFGLGLFGSGLWWVYISIHDFGDAEPAAATALTGLLIGAWAVFPALAGYLAVKFNAGAKAWSRATLFAAVWVVVEYLRGDCLLNGFPWLLIGYAQSDTPLAGYAPIVGVYGVGFLLALSAFAWVEIVAGTIPWRRGLPVVLLMWSGGAVLRGVAWTEPAGAPFKVTLVQGNVGQDRKWDIDQRAGTLSLYRDLTEAHWDSDVVIWPETAVPAFLNEVQAEFIEPLRADALRHGTELVLGLPSGGQGKHYYNSVLALGENQQLYHKHHLLPFGEYLPLQPLSGWILDLMAIPLGDFAAGADRQPLLSAGGYRFVTTICYEDAFGELVARQIADAAYIVNLTNDAWFGDSAQPYQHLQMARMRALETGRYLVRATNTGVTGFVGPDGRILSAAPSFTATTVTADIVPMRGVTPYARFGDVWVLAVLVAGVGALKIGWLVIKP